MLRRLGRRRRRLLTAYPRRTPREQTPASVCNQCTQNTGNNARKAAESALVMKRSSVRFRQAAPPEKPHFARNGASFVPTLFAFILPSFLKILLRGYSQRSKFLDSRPARRGRWACASLNAVQ